MTANVFKASATQTVQNNNIETLSKKPINSVTANKTRAACNQNPQTNTNQTKNKSKK
jgi:hypothetical protein